MFQNQVRTGLANFAIAVTQEEPNERTSGNHSVQRERDGFRGNGASGGDRLVFLGAGVEVQADGVPDAFLRRLTGLCDTIKPSRSITIAMPPVECSLFA